MSDATARRTPPSSAWSQAHCRIAAVSSRLDRTGVVYAAATSCRAPRRRTGPGLAQPPGVDLGQVDLVPPTVEPEINGTSCRNTS
jgi:hypothetical protein